MPIMNHSKHFLRLLPATLAILLTLFCTACHREGANTPEVTTEAETVYVMTMAEVKAEINSKETTDFTETTQTTEYIKITVKDHGDIILRLRPDVAPITAANFQRLVGEGFYDGITFHRIYKGFMIQGGDPDGDGVTDPHAEGIKGEFSSNGVENNLLHERGVISMARTNVPNSASSQFFIMHQANAGLDGNYAAFGRVLTGMSLVDGIATMATDGNDVPLNNAYITKACFVEYTPANEGGEDTTTGGESVSE